MDREVIHSLFSLFDERIAIHLPGQFFRAAAGFLECLVNRDGADRHRRVPQDPFSRLVNIAAGGKIHHRVGAPVDAPAHLLDFFLDGAGDRTIADVGIDLDQEISADDHRLEFDVIDVGGNDRASTRYFIPHKFRGDVFGNLCPERLALMLEPDVSPAVGGFESLLAAEILASRDKLHFGCDNSLPRVMDLTDGAAIRCLARSAANSRKDFQAVASRALLSVFVAEISVVFGLHITAGILDGIAALKNPGFAHRRQAAVNVALHLGVAPRTTRVVNA